jgi:hypothetical protein
MGDGMDFVNEKRIIHLGEICAQCGTPISSPNSMELRLCNFCFEERCGSENSLRSKARRHFNLKNAPSIRRCFLELLLSHKVDLDPSGWRTGMAVGCELRDAGFDTDDSKKILMQAGGKVERVSKLLDVVYGRKRINSLSCDQIRALTVACHGCPKQFRAKQKESITEIIKSSHSGDIHVSLPSSDSFCPSFL